MRVTAIFLTLACTSLANAEDRLLRLWPADVRMPVNLRAYQPTLYTQRLTITNGYDRLAVVHRDEPDHTVNGNGIFPWRISGGMHTVRGNWESLKGLALPPGKPIRWWKEWIEAGARRPLPRLAWQYPEGTVAVDLLLYDGKPFELRTLTRTADGWNGAAVWHSGTVPPGYHGAGRKCMECHQSAGAWERYGPLLRGADGLFSPPILRGGSRVIDWAAWSGGELDSDAWALKHWEEPKESGQGLWR